MKEENTITLDQFRELANSETEYGEPQLWVNLPKGRSLEITHEEYGLKKTDMYFSARLHCSDEEFDRGMYHATCGVLDTWTSTDGNSIDIDNIKALAYKTCATI